MRRSRAETPTLLWLALLGAVLAIAALAFLVLRRRDQRAAGASRIQEPASKR